MLAVDTLSGVESLDFKFFMIYVCFNKVLVLAAFIWVQQLPCSLFYEDIRETFWRFWLVEHETWFDLVKKSLVVLLNFLITGIKALPWLIICQIIAKSHEFS